MIEKKGVRFGVKLAPDVDVLAHKKGKCPYNRPRKTHSTIIAWVI